MPDKVTIEPGGDWPIPFGKQPWLPQAVYVALSSPDQPAGAYPLYVLLRRISNSHGEQLDIRGTLAAWRSGVDPNTKILSLSTRELFAGSAHALTQMGCLLREPTAAGEHWTPLVFKSKRQSSRNSRRQAAVV
jgi:hypothetical protein